jgi:hypothetical protein
LTGSYRKQVRGFDLALGLINSSRFIGLEGAPMQSGINRQQTKHSFLLALSLSLLTSFSTAAVLADDLQSGSKAAPTNIAGVDTSAPKSINAPEDLQRWMEFYYLHPQPELLVPALHFADSSGLVKQGEAPLTAFVSRIFAQNPKSIAGWTASLSDLSPASRPMLWSALWWSSTIEGKEQLNKLATSYPNPRDQDAVLSQMAKPSEPVDQMAMNRPEVLDELWGAFSATGDEKYINRLISTLPWLTDNGGDYIKLTIAGAAKWSLVSNARVHPKVLACVMQARQNQPALKRTLDAVIAEAQKASTNQNQQAASNTSQ